MCGDWGGGAGGLRGGARASVGPAKSKGSANGLNSLALWFMMCKSYRGGGVSYGPLLGIWKDGCKLARSSLT